jgi:hypothetical protein
MNSKQYKNYENNVRLASTLKKMMQAKIQKYLNKKINKSTCLQIYNDIFLCIQEIVLMVPDLNNVITEKGINYIAQSYYDMIEINKGVNLNPNIFTKRVTVHDLPTKELSFCGILLMGTPLVSEVVNTVKSRV